MVGLDLENNRILSTAQRGLINIFSKKGFKGLISQIEPSILSKIKASLEVLRKNSNSKEVKDLPSILLHLLQFKLFPEPGTNY